MGEPVEKKHPEERRLVSVLFADVLGFTPLADQLDFEIVGDLIRGLWLKLDQVIEKYGGYIDKHMGDAFMVIWGAPRTQEDDAERAVSAGLEILSALDEYKMEVDHPAAKNLRLRVGIHSGLALTGYVGLGGEYTVMGNTVNIAKRLEEQADPGSLYISESTYHFVRGGYRIRNLNPMQLKGIEDLIHVYEVIERLEQPSKLRYRSVGGLETLLVGRQKEIIFLGKLFQQAKKKEQPTLVLVTGEAGIGKSRLLMEFVSHREVENPHLTVMSSRALQQTKQVPFFLWKELWSNRFDLNEGDEEKSAREKIIHGVRTLWGKQLGKITALETAHFLGDQIGVAWPESPYLKPYQNNAEKRKQRSYELHGEILFRTLMKGPLILMLDDLQWVDHASLELLKYLLEDCPKKLPILILGATRPEIFDEHTDLNRKAEVIALDPLPASSEIVREAYPALESAPEKVLEELAQRAEGNPYYLEELVKRLFQTGYDGVSETEISGEMPPSLQMLLQARLDALSTPARATALFASVIGRVFWRGAVMSLILGISGVTKVFNISSKDLNKNVEDSLKELMRAELAFPRVGSAFSGEREYIFKHSMLRDVAYRLIPKKHRGKCHIVVAEWLAERAGPERSVSIANHYELAGMIDQAQEYYQKAGQYARSQGNLQEALEFEQNVSRLA
ncbi:MAG: AAA family ATPase [Anaerolineales bacterium]|nr:AAA family ATPase [Anaerolineales bacterium]